MNKENKKGAKTKCIRIKKKTENKRDRDWKVGEKEKKKEKLEEKKK